jgi:hypothetical protein
VKKVFALAEIQVAENAECDLTTVFERLILQALVSPLITIDMFVDFIAYYRGVWMVRPQPWNVFSLDKRRTNNHMEGWHNRMNSEVKTKQNLWQFIDLIKKEETAREAEINQMNHGGIISPQNYKQKVKEKALAGYKARYIAGTISPYEYLCFVSQRMGFYYHSSQLISHMVFKFYSCDSNVRY